MFKRLVIVLMLACHAVAAVAALPRASVMMHGMGGAVSAAHHGCADETAPVAAAVHDNAGCTDCDRAASPCCSGLLALPLVNGLLLAPPHCADRPGHTAGMQAAGRGESIYRPPRV